MIQNVEPDRTPLAVLRVANGLIDTSTGLSDASSGDNFRGATSTNGFDIWVSGNASAGALGGLRYTTLGGTTSVQLSSSNTNTRGVIVAGGQSG